MNSTAATGLADTSALRLFMDFPVPLALFHPEGGVDLTNAQFDRLIDPSCLVGAELRDIVLHPGRPWRAVQIPRRDGVSSSAQVQATRIAGRILLTVETTPGQAVASELAELNQRIAELERSSASDHLTGAWNRAHLDRTIEAELSRSIRYQQPLSLILMDVDHFKKVNDTFGHQTGDAVLRELVKITSQNKRAADLLFRWGGEEFVVLATASGYRAAERLAEHLRTSVSRHRFPGAGSVTISLGVAEHCGSESAEAWFGRLDAALYSAKRRGRNRVEVDRRGNSDEWAASAHGSVLRLIWREAYECGQPVIDSQHRRLFDLANELIDASVQASEDASVLETALDNLLAHVAQALCR